MHPGGEFVADAAVTGSQRSAATRPYGRLLIFTLLDDKVADFDRLAEQTAEEVQIGEPDTLVYVIHLVPNAPMQRIFYEIYRDRAAFDSHENKSYMQRFVTERRAYVLATNVIELRLKYAKVAPLPQGPRSQEPMSLESGRSARAQLPPGSGPPGFAAPGVAGPGFAGPGTAAPRAAAQRPGDPTRYGRVV
jgi:quinol monooxygenase YgiN